MRLLKLILPYFAMLEGVSHFVVSTIAIVGMGLHHNLTFFGILTPLFDYLMGVGTFLAGWVFRRRDAKRG